MDKEQQLVLTAFTLFYREGVHATGINRILSESGIAKKTLYSYFKSKDELIAATLRYRHTLFLSWLTTRMNRVEAGRHALEELFSALDDWFHNKVQEMSDFQGCYFINVAAEYADFESPIHQLCAAHKQSVLALIQSHVVLAGIEGREIDYVSQLIGIVKEGAIVQASILGDLEAANKAKKVVETLLMA